MVGEAAGADGVEETEGAEAVNVALCARGVRIRSSQSSEAGRETVEGPTHGVLGHVKRDLDVRLSSEVVDLGRLDRRDDRDEVGRVRQVCLCARGCVRSELHFLGREIETHRRSGGPSWGLRVTELPRE